MLFAVTDKDSASLKTNTKDSLVTSFVEDSTEELYGRTQITPLKSDFYAGYIIWYKLLKHKNISDTSRMAELLDFQSFVIEKEAALVNTYFYTSDTLYRWDRHASGYHHYPDYFSLQPDNARKLLAQFDLMRFGMQDVFAAYNRNSSYSTIPKIQNLFHFRQQLAERIFPYLLITVSAMTACLFIFLLRLFPVRLVLVNGAIVTGICVGGLFLDGPMGTLLHSPKYYTISEDNRLFVTAEHYLLFFVVIYLALFFLSSAKIFFRNLFYFSPIAVVLALIYLSLDKLENSDSFNTKWDLIIGFFLIIFLPLIYYSLYLLYVQPERRKIILWKRTR